MASVAGVAFRAETFGPRMAHGIMAMGVRGRVRGAGTHPTFYVNHSSPRGGHLRAALGAAPRFPYPNILYVTVQELCTSLVPACSLRFLRRRQAGHTWAPNQRLGNTRRVPFLCPKAKAQHSIVVRGASCRTCAPNPPFLLNPCWATMCEDTTRRRGPLPTRAPKTSRPAVHEWPPPARRVRRPRWPQP